MTLHRYNEGCKQYNEITILNPAQPTFEVQFKFKNKRTGEKQEGETLVKGPSEERVRELFTEYLNGFEEAEDIQLWIGQVYL